MKAATGLAVKDVMNPRVLTVTEDMTLQELATFLTENEISGAPVVDGAGRVVGVVSLTDIALTAAEGGDLVRDRSDPGFFVRGWEESVSPEELEGLHVENEGLEVRHLMTDRIYSVPEDAPVSEAARQMADGHLHRLLVLRDGELAGIVTTSDLLRLLAEEG